MTGGRRTSLGPPSPDRPAQSLATLRITLLGAPPQCRPEVVLLEPQSVQPGGEVGSSAQMRLRLLAERNETVHMSRAHRPGISRRDESLQRELPKRLQ
jgi:hypothetical protein